MLVKYDRVETWLRFALQKVTVTFCKAEPIETINEEQNGKIESVKKKGYVYFSPDHETEIIRHAEVIVYRLKSKGGGL